MSWTAPIMIVSYVFLLLFCLMMYVVDGALTNIQRLLHEISDGVRQRSS